MAGCDIAVGEVSEGASYRPTVVQHAVSVPGKAIDSDELPVVEAVSAVLGLAVARDPQDVPRRHCQGTRLEHLEARRLLHRRSPGGGIDTLAGSVSLSVLVKHQDVANA